MSFSAAAFSPKAFSPSAFLFQGLPNGAAEVAPGARRSYRDKIEENARERQIRRVKLEAYKQGMHAHLKDALVPKAPRASGSPLQRQDLEDRASRREALVRSIAVATTTVTTERRGHGAPIEQRKLRRESAVKTGLSGDDETVLLCAAFLI